MTTYFSFCIVAGFYAMGKGWSFWPSFLFSIILTPVIVFIGLYFLGDSPGKVYNEYLREKDFEEEMEREFEEKRRKRDISNDADLWD